LKVMFKRPGMRSRLIAWIVLIIMIPILLTVGTLGISLRLMEVQASEQLTEIEVINRKLLSEIIASYQDIDRPEKVYQRLAPLLNQYHLRVRIRDVFSQTLFDSAEYAGEPKPKPALAGNQSNHDLPLVIGDSIAGTVTVIPDLHTPPYNVYTKMMSYVLGSIGAGFLSLIVLLILLTRLITKNILRPLQELSQATQEVARGSLDFKLKHKTGDELGQFVEAFDLMRLRLKESLDKQAAYALSRKQLIANISHDLATPTAIIRGYVEGLEDGVARDEESFKRYLRVIRSKTEQLDRLIEDLAQYSRLELGRLEIHKEDVDSGELFEGIFSALETSLENSSATFLVKRPLPSVALQADKNRIEQVLDNLVGNAQRYSGDYPVIKAEIEVLEDQLLVKVQDNGSGIPGEDLPHIFELFYRGEKSRSRDFGGSGQGLAICRFIVEAHGGKIWAESAPGQGSTFYFTLPVSPKACHPELLEL